MTYTEWRDELKSNLLSVSENERRRVLEYYAEAYADRREAGFSEREIIADFGAPYDAAQRILNEDDREVYEAPRRVERREAYDEPRREERREVYEPAPVRRDYYDEPPARTAPCETKRAEENKQNKKGKTSWVFVLLCVIFAIPIFAIIMALCAMTVAAFVAPFAVLIAGVGEAGLGVGVMFSDVLEGCMRVGFGLILFGVGVILISILPRIAKLIWTVFKKIGGFIKSLFTTEAA